MSLVCVAHAFFALSQGLSSLFFFQSSILFRFNWQETRYVACRRSPLRHLKVEVVYPPPLLGLYLYFSVTSSIACCEHPYGTLEYSFRHT